MHRRLIEAVLAAARALGGVKRKIGVAHERIGAGAPGVPNRDSDRSADQDLMAFDEIRSRNLLDQSPRERFEEADVDASGEDRLEFVAAQTADLAVIAHDRLQPLADLAEKRIADRVAERVVDVLESIEIDHEQRAALLAMVGVAQSF